MVLPFGTEYMIRPHKGMTCCVYYLFSALGRCSLNRLAHHVFQYSPSKLLVVKDEAGCIFGAYSEGVCVLLLT